MTTALTEAELHRPLNRNDYKTLSLSALGGALEFYDFVIYVFFAAVIGKLFFPATMPDWLAQLQTFGIFAAGYLARPLGGIIIAHFGDKLGRKRMFTLSIFLMAVPTLAIGLLPTYASIGIAAPLLLLLFRILQGAAIGGEVPGAWVFVTEHVPASRTGMAVGTLTAGLTAGILLGSLVAVAINKHYTPAEVLGDAWRIPFILGGVFGFFAVYLRRFLEETPIFKELHARQELAQGLPLKPILQQHIGAVGVSMLLTWVLSAAIVVVILFTPTYLQKVHHITPILASEANAFATLALTFGCVFFGWASDRFGARVTMIVGYLGLLASSYYFYMSLPDTEVLLRNYTVTGFFVGAIATVPFVAVRAFPAAVRFSGLSFSYNVAYAIFGGLTPVVLSWWLTKDLQAPSHYVAALSVLGLLLAFTAQAGRKALGTGSKLANGAA
ncbi:MFS transporter [Andreprevotia chitinilytica]|uniref:MFS transporter n=1 Tax=Andreprevotia chitinilytica TaxID=396808 RepID=UPI00055688DF|nr:MFS transporter [Andreprevotia chitinilytica]